MTHKKVEACRSSSVLFVKTLYCNIVRLLEHSLILTISARIRIAEVSKIVCKTKIYTKVNHAKKGKKKWLELTHCCSQWPVLGSEPRLLSRLL